MSIAPSSLPRSTWSRGSNPSAAKSRGVPTCSSDDVVVLPAGRNAWLDDVGQRVRNARRDRSCAASRSASASLTAAASSFGRRASNAAVLGRRRPARPACPVPSARRAWCRSPTPPRGAPLVRGDQGVDQRGVLAAGTLGGADASGSSRTVRRSITPPRVPAGPPLPPARAAGRLSRGEPDDHVGQLRGRHRPRPEEALRHVAAERPQPLGHARASSTPSATADRPNSWARSTIALTSTGRPSSRVEVVRTSGRS